jgi:fructosamine-3-kinase
LDARLAAALGPALGSEVTGARPLAGGDINQAYSVGLADGREVFVKTNGRAPAAMFPAEARGLRWLAEADVLRVPRVIAVSGQAEEGEEPRFLALELIRPGRPRPGFDEMLGRGLASLHRAGAPSFGLDHDNFIGRLPQSNRPSARGGDGWAAFYRDRRLQPQLELAVKSMGAAATARMRRGFERLFAEIEGLVGPDEPPCRLHGDLWGGNLMCDEGGQPCLIDPAVYGGHREIDLAMMRLFGGFGARVFAAYHEAWPLADGHGERVALYQLYPLMVHVNLFGGGYVGQVEAVLDTLV